MSECEDEYISLLQPSDNDDREDDVDYHPDMPYGRIYNRTLELTQDFPSLPDKHYVDRQGLLAGQARLLGTFSQLRTCPYNESHRIGEGKYHNHIIKCRQAHPEKAASIIICEYDASHHIPEEMYGMHLKVCYAHNEYTAVGRLTLTKPPIKDKVRCFVKFFDEEPGEASGSNKDDKTTINLTEMEEAEFSEKTIDYKWAKFEGPPMNKPTATKHTWWF